MAVEKKLFICKGKWNFASSLNLQIPLLLEYWKDKETPNDPNEFNSIELSIVDLSTYSSLTHRLSTIFIVFYY